MYESLRKDLDGVKSDAKKVTETKENFSKLVKANEKLSYEFETIQRESMRDNLLFHGLNEKEEDCIQLIKRVCSKYLSWNINGGFEENMKDVKFKNYICTYDIVFFSECWINTSNTCDIEIEDFVCKSVPLGL